METTANAQVASAPVSDNKTKQPAKPVTQAVTTWQHGTQPMTPAGARVLGVGQDTGRLNKLGQPILSKSLVIRPPTAKETALPGEQALRKIQEVGASLKPAIMGRVAAFSNNAAVIVRRYSETPGKRDKMSLVLERISVESTCAKLAREYGMTEEEVRKRLGITTVAA